MMKRYFPLLIFVSLILTCANGYRVFYMREMGSCSSDSIEINVGSESRNSSGILVSDVSSDFEPDLNCKIYLRPPLSYGIVASIRRFDLQPATLSYGDCENYLEISPVEETKSVKICGYSDDPFEYQSYLNWGAMRISFFTSNSSIQQKASFQLTFTAVRKEKRFCFKNEKRCRNRNCIWKGLTCDGHNNCGDLSDELDKHISQCAPMSPGESLAVILVTIIVSLILLFIAAYLRGPKITRQIERLSQQNCSDTTRPESAHGTDSVTQSIVPALHRIRTNYGSTSQLLPSNDFNDLIIHDPPPRYEEVIGSIPVSVAVVQNSANFSSLPVEHAQAAVADSHTSVTVPEVSVDESNSRQNYIHSNPHGS